jgi:hypothetical protein
MSLDYHKKKNHNFVPLIISLDDIEFDSILFMKTEVRDF